MGAGEEVGDVGAAEPGGGGGDGEHRARDEHDRATGCEGPDPGGGEPERPPRRPRPPTATSTVARNERASSRPEATGSTMSAATSSVPTTWVAATIVTAASTTSSPLSR